LLPCLLFHYTIVIVNVNGLSLIFFKLFWNRRKSLVSKELGAARPAPLDLSRCRVRTYSDPVKVSLIQFTKKTPAKIQENNLTANGASLLKPQMRQNIKIKNNIILVDILPRSRHAIQTLARILRGGRKGTRYRMGL